MVFIASAIQSDEKRRRICFIYSSTAILHHTILGQETGFIYYFSAALCSIAIMPVIAMLGNFGRFTRNLLMICMSAAILNASGWVLYELYFDPIVYNNLFLVLYSIAIALMLNEEINDKTINHRRSFGFFGGID